MAKILLLEDDLALKQSLSAILMHQQHQVLSCSTIARFEGLLDKNCFDLLILDRHLKDGDVYQSLAGLNLKNKPSRTLIISQSADKNFKSTAFDLGSNDVLAKPFALQEFYLRVKNLLSLVKESSNKIYKLGQLSYFPKFGVLKNGSSEQVFRPRENMIFAYLFRQRGQIVSASDIINYIWQDTFLPNKNTIEVYIRRIRSKLMENKDKLQTIRGVGYRLKW